MNTSFIELGLPQRVVDRLAERGMTEAFPIQSMALPPAIEGKDVCGRAPTGSGKTLAFGIPLAERVGQAKPKRPRALILAPTRELASQIQEEMRPLLAPHKRSVASFYGGVGINPQVNALRKGVDVAVACPGRLMDLVQRGDFILDDVDIVVIDEADRMADMGFLPEVKKILDKVKPNRQTLLFSATLDGDVDILIKRYQKNPVRCEIIADESHLERITHRWVETSREDRVNLAADLIIRNGSTVVFCRTKYGADRVARQLQRAGITSVPIHGGRSQSQRDRALKAFTNGEVLALVATDVAARGIHVDNVGCVIHFDPAADHKDYTHRSGRTGRAGEDGIVFTLVVPEDRKKVTALQRSLKMEQKIEPSPELSNMVRTPVKPIEPAKSGGAARGPRNGKPRPSRGKNSARANKGGGGGNGGKGRGQKAGASNGSKSSHRSSAKRSSNR